MSTNRKLKKVGMVAVLALLALMLNAPLFAEGQQEGASSGSMETYPSKPVTLIVPWGAGGGADTTARTFAAVAGNYFGQPVVPVLQEGASGTIAHGEYLKVKPDGYTLLITGNSPIVTVPAFRKVPYDPLTSFKFVARLINLRNVIAVYKDRPYKTLDEFIAYAKAHPGEIKIGNSGAQGIGDMTIMLMEQKLGIDVTSVPFTTSGEAVVAASGGHIDAVSGSLTGASAQMDAGNLIPLAVTAFDRDPNYPDIPTFIEKGYQVAIDNQIGIGVPADTPDEIVDFINEAIKKTVSDESYKNLAGRMEMTIDYLGPEEFLESIKISVNSVKEAVAGMEK